MADPEVPLWQAIDDVFSRMTVKEYFARPRNMGVHNLCKNRQPPPGTTALLGLGLNFIPQKRFPKPDFKETAERFLRDVRIRFMFPGDRPNNDRAYDPKLYIRSEITPEEASRHVENCTTSFLDGLRTLIQNNKVTKATNLTRHQQQTLKILIENDDFIVFMADKNLGPCIMEREEYIKWVLTDHLLDYKTYKQLTVEEAAELRRDARHKMMELLDTYRASLPQHEQTYFDRCTNIKRTRTPVFYITAKVHKSPIKSRPVVSSCGSFLSYLSTWIDRKLQTICTQRVPTYIRDSEHLRLLLISLGVLPRGAKLFTTDAVAMYTNICIDHALEAIRQWFEQYEDELPPNYPTEMILDSIELVMKNNVFDFGDTHWLQLIGSAMGTPAACTIATLYYACHERNLLIPKYSSNLHFIRRFIDDMLCIWIPDPTRPRAFEEFKRDLSYGLLKWDTEPLSNSVNFLDLTITINSQNRIETKTYQKAMNLYLYIPPNSAHPPGLQKSQVYGTLLRYYRQNTHIEDFKTMATLFFDRLIARGHNRTHLKTLFKDAAKKIDAKVKKAKSGVPLQDPDEAMPNHQRLFLHTTYHPKCVSRQAIQNLYERTCGERSTVVHPTRDDRPGLTNAPNFDGGVMRIRKLTVAYHRDKNLRDMVSPSRLYQPAGMEASTILGQVSNEQPPGRCDDSDSNSNPDSQDNQ